MSHASLKKLANLAEKMAPHFQGEGEVKYSRKNTVNKCSPLLPTPFYNLVTEMGKEGLSIQRFKGLGEMNADQLWDTTLNPKNRTLLQVRIEDFDSVEETFSMLMSSVVEPRKEFIKQHAEEVKNLDA